MIELQRYLAEQFVQLYEFLRSAYGQAAALADRALQRARRDYLDARSSAAAAVTPLRMAA